LGMSSRWLNGVISAYCDGTYSDRRTYFVSTPEGIAIAFPRIHNDHPDVKVGVYVRVRARPPPNRSVSMEVEDMIIIGLPHGHSIVERKREVKISCQAVLKRIESYWSFFHNDYLGGIVKKRLHANIEKELEIGKSYRVVCRRARRGDDVSWSVIAYWVIERLERIDDIRSNQIKSQQEKSIDRNEVMRSEEKKEEEVENSRERPIKSIIPHMRRLFMDENVYHLFEEYDEKLFKRIREICDRWDIN
ncbi:hypothetical protein PENTCL1PPCAC_18219, partial [Pristionchus entomophagus]